MTGSPSVSVLVPYRGDQSGHRDAAWRFVRGWWGSSFPGWQLLQGACPVGPWVKASAVSDALAQCDGQVLVIADADVICPDVGWAVAAVDAGAPWAIPHRRVVRLTPTATYDVMGGAPLPEPSQTVRALRPIQRPLAVRVAESYVGIAGGGLVVLTRELYERVPLDPRFHGWGQEDLAWAHALNVTAGQPRRGDGPLWHLWHPPAPRMSRSIGTPTGLALHRRYKHATSPSAIAAIIAEFTRPPDAGRDGGDG